MGAVIIEAGYYGCPSIAPKSFGIPELIIKNQTGLIIDIPFTSEDFYNKIISLIENKIIYQNMRKQVRDFTIENLSWHSIGKKIHSFINEYIDH